MSSEQIIANLQQLLEQGQDNALIHFGLGNAYLNASKPAQAITHLRQALKHDPDYSAAWKLYAKALTANKQKDAAIEAYQQGIIIAEKKGDIQGSKEMKIFLNRLSPIARTE